MDTLAIVVPCYNEEEMFPITVKALRELLKSLREKGKIAQDSKVLFVNDGSKDKTWELIEQAYEEYDDVYGICLARNVGHQNALLSGLSAAKEFADMVISVDADLQDDISKMEDMVDSYLEGNDIVYGVRNSRKKDTFFKRQSAQIFYKLLSVMGVETVYNHADYRLMSKRAIAELEKYQESNLYLRGMIPLIGYKTGKVYYERLERQAGESKYPFKKMLALAMNGITSFSVKPLTMITNLGIFIVICSIVAAIYAFISYFYGCVEKGWTSMILSIWLLGGVQLIGIGVLGEYIGKIYTEVKHRPKYNIMTYLGDKKKHGDFSEE